jgi:hypothetical protein
MRGRRHDSIGLPGGRRHNDPDPAGTHVAVAGQSHTDDRVADELKQTAKPHDARINVDQECEVKYWSENFGVSRERLRSAVAKVGSMVKNVRKHLQQRS